MMTTVSFLALGRRAAGDLTPTVVLFFDGAKSAGLTG
jgi:hypothetical protein